jgi:hypothetical protein
LLRRLQFGKISLKTLMNSVKKGWLRGILEVKMDLAKTTFI